MVDIDAPTIIVGREYATKREIVIKLTKPVREGNGYFYASGYRLILSKNRFSENTLTHCLTSYRECCNGELTIYGKGLNS